LFSGLFLVAMTLSRVGSSATSWIHGLDLGVLQILNHCINVMIEDLEDAEVQAMM